MKTDSIKSDIALNMAIVIILLTSTDSLVAGTFIDSEIIANIKKYYAFSIFMLILFYYAFSQNPLPKVVVETCNKRIAVNTLLTGLALVFSMNLLDIPSDINAIVFAILITGNLVIPYSLFIPIVAVYAIQKKSISEGQKSQAIVNYMKAYKYGSKAGLIFGGVSLILCITNYDVFRIFVVLETIIAAVGIYFISITSLLNPNKEDLTE